MDYLVDHDDTTKPLIITFGGISGQFHQPLFEFKKFLQKSVDCHFIYLKDTKQAWYQRGVVGIGDTIPEVVQSLKNIIKNINYSKIITLGSSMGGYAALLFGKLLEVDKILAFVPQTFISQKDLRTHGDLRFIDPIDAMHASTRVIYDDLSKFDYKDGQVTIVYGKDELIDKVHADKIRNATLESYEGGHCVVKTLRDKGILIKIIQNLL